MNTIRIFFAILGIALAAGGAARRSQQPRDSRVNLRSDMTVSRSIGGHRRGNHCASCARDGRGRIARSPTAKSAFRMFNPCPATGKLSGACPGYVIDHIVALKRGGPDHPDKMQWQTVEEAKAKDRIE